VAGVHLDIEKELLPYRFDMELADELFTFEVQHNERFDFFTIDLKKDGETLVLGEKVMLNRVLFSLVADPRLPKVYLIPLDESGVESRVSYDNLGEKVFIYIGEVAI
jgi:hypothetical protein